MTFIKIAFAATLAALVYATSASALSLRGDVEAPTGAEVAALTRSSDRLFVTVAGVDSSQRPTYSVQAIAISSGKRDMGFKVQLDGPAVSLAIQGSRLLVGGAFKTVNGQTHRNLAAVDSATGSPVAAFNPSPDESVAAIATSSTRIYVGGYFNRIGGRSQPRLAALNSAGTVLSRFPSVAGVVRTSGCNDRRGLLSRVLALELSGSRLYVTGQFSSVGRVARRSLAAIDLSKGSVSTRFKNGQLNCSAVGRELAASPARLYVGGKIVAIDGVKAGRLVALSSSTGTRVRSFSVPSSGPGFGTIVQGLALGSHGVYANDVIYSRADGRILGHLPGRPRVKQLLASPTHLFASGQPASLASCSGAVNGVFTNSCPSLFVFDGTP